MWKSQKKLQGEKKKGITVDDGATGGCGRREGRGAEDFYAAV